MDIILSHHLCNSMNAFSFLLFSKNGSLINGASLMMTTAFRAVD